MKNVILKFGISHLFHQNEPINIAMIGNILLLIAGAGTAVLGLPATLAVSGVVLALPAVVVTGAHIAISLGVFGKIITKMFGTVDKTTGEVVNTTIPSVIEPSSELDKKG